MSKHNIEEVYNSLELPIGTRFHFRKVPYEVVELENEAWGCSECDFDDENDENKEEICEVMNCNCRQDKKVIFFKEVGETEEEG